MSPVIPPKDLNKEPAGTSFRTTKGALAEVDLIAALESEERSENISRNDVLNWALEWALEQLWKDRNRARPKDPLSEWDAFQRRKAKK